MLQNKRVYVIFFVMVVLAFVIGIAILGAAPRKSGSSSSTATNSNPAIKTNCNHPLDYWVAHSERYPPYLVIGDQKYFRKEVAAILANPDPAQALLKQVLAAFLNASTEGRQGGNSAELLEAYQWLAAHPAGGVLTEGDRLDNVRLVTALQKFNDGLASLPLCDGPRTPTPTASAISTRTPTMVRIFAPTATPTATLTPSSTPTRTSTPSITPTRTATSTKTVTRTATRTIVLPTRTEEPTSGYVPATVRPTNTEVILPTWTPTREIIVPTWTPIPPSNTPGPANTPTPINTPPQFETTQPTSAPNITPTEPPPPAPGWLVPTSVVAARPAKLGAIFIVYIRMLENSVLLPKGR